LDKGKAAAVTSVVETRDKSGKLIFENQSTVFIRGSGGFGGPRAGTGKTCLALARLNLTAMF
jgi:multifunctional beta-oxidation protein